MGRSSLIMVLGFSIALILKGYNLSNVSTDAYNNVVQYYNKSAGHTLAESNMNIGCNLKYLTANAYPTWTDRSMDGGRVNLSTFNAPHPPYDTGLVVMLSTSKFPYPPSSDPSKNYYDTVMVIWGLRNFAAYAYYSNTEGSINWQTGDTIYGPFHTQDFMTVSGSPVFMGHVTNQKGMTKNQTPEFHAGYQTGINIPMDTDFSHFKNAVQTNGRYLHGTDYTLTFDSTGHMDIKPWGAKPDTVVLISTFVPNGTLQIDSANVRIKGIFTGQLTIAVLAEKKANKGKMYLDSSVVYAHDPTKGPSSDLLGLCADDSIVITENANNGTPSNQCGITIQAALYSINKGLGAQNYDDNKARGRIRLLGGVQQKQRAAVGLVGGASGYYKSYTYDQRLLTSSPPSYPSSGAYQILSWYER